MEYEKCVRRRIKVDGDNVYITVGAEFATVTGRFENRLDNKTISRKGVELINQAIIQLREDAGGTQ